MVDKTRVSVPRENSSQSAPSITATLPSSNDGNQIRNKILLALPAKEKENLLPKLEFMRLNIRHVLHEPGDSLRSVYFPNSGLVSILSVFPDGKCVEVGLVGKEGFVGHPLVAGFRTANTRAIVQIAGSAFRVDADALMGMLRQSPVLERRLQECSQILAMEVTQVAACNRLHEVNERLARWLLMCADRIDSTSVPLTQEFLAHMLGTRRSSVTVAAGILEVAGLITNSRGKIDIVDRSKLEKAACECYQIMQTQLGEWRSQSA
jgi:cAMP-binding proteins - catabolite gene activator and regulatory subunit of cAMP-dependent protein kinases